MRATQLAENARLCCMDVEAHDLIVDCAFPLVSDFVDQVRETGAF